MRRIAIWLLRISIAAALAAIVVGLWKREEITRLLVVNSLFDAEKIIANFSNMDRAFLHVDLPRGDGPVSDLPQGILARLPDTVDQWIIDRSVTSLLVLKDGEIVFEDYYKGTGPEDLRIGWSVSKSFLSSLFGIVLAEGAIASLDDYVTKYAPELIGGAYDKFTIRQVLSMTTGVKFDEDYLDYNSDIKRMGRVLALGKRMDDFAADLTETFTEPGKEYQYVSIDTHVVSMVIRGATGRSIADLMSEKIIRPLALERDPYYVTDGVGVAFVLGGLNMTTRDYARFGQMILQGGFWNGRQIVPRNWIDVATAPQGPAEPGEFKFGFHWFIPEDAGPDEFLGRGIYGQYVYINKTKDVVIVSTAGDLQFRHDGVSTGNIDIFRLIAGSM